MNEKTAKTVDAVVTLLIASFFVALIVYIWQDFYGRMTQYACDTSPLIVEQGDTIYDLVMANCVGALEVAVDDNVETYGTNIQIGQQVVLQSNPDCAMRVTDGGEVFADC